ncbi:acyl-CoA synthetase [Herminiimonas sp. CN]|uniref:LpxL/LpxP family acyltransferase n=1 Tax=Herminiimonas sp. CN TaxID=1349818 RepID=UPI0004736D5F|nr:acyl-CoA synthetase [Herminiimonas sp. CN]
MKSPQQNQADWQHAPERSNMLMLRAMAWISLRLGRPAGRVVLHLIAGYFLLFAPASRAASRDYLGRILPRPVRWTDIYRHFFCFASTIHDRIYLLNQRFDLFQIEVEGEQLLRQALADGQGLFLVGAHMGSFEVIRALGCRHAGLQVAMVMYEENARKINRMLAAINPAAQQDVIALGKVDSMLKVNACLEQGKVIGMLADRTLDDDAVQPVTLLGSSANLPLGPLRMAAILRRPVFFMAGLYLGGNRYQIHFEQLADFSGTPRGQRQLEMQRALARYAQLLEKCCQRAPYNWFNFFNFWQSAAAKSKQD